MKKLFIYILTAIAIISTSSCKDDDSTYSESADRLAQPLFRTERTVPSGSSDPYICQLSGLNTIKLYWSRVDGAKGYEIRYTTSQSVAGSLENWLDADGTYNVKDTILYGEDVDQLVLQHLEYSKTYRFAIRALSDRGEEHNSNWYGIGDLHHYAEMCYLSTSDRYETPVIITQKGDVTKESFKLYLNRSYDHYGATVDGKQTKTDYTADQLDVFNEHFGTSTSSHGNKVWNVDYLVIYAASSNPDAKVPAEFTKLKLTEDMFDENEEAVITVNGVDSNSVYNMYVMDQTIADTLSLVDSEYNLDISVRTKGTPGAPILIASAPQDTIHATIDGAETALTLPVAATPIQPLLADFMNNNAYSEGQAFYLEGGKTYFVTSGLQIYKGLTLQTNPEDIAAGKGRAKILMYDANTLRGLNASPAFFMLSRTPVGSENPMITIDIEKFEISDIDFCIPKALNCGDGTVSNNYFMNMYSSGMGAVLGTLKITNCSFQDIVGGFYRVQANYGVKINNFLIDNCDFYNGGFYSTSGRRYNYFHANPEANKNINIWNNFVMTNCTIYDNPLGYMFNHNKQQSIEWPDDVHYNITLKNNTFINWSCATGNLLFNLRWIPGGSTFTVQNNLFVLTKSAEDTNRKLFLSGCDIRTINGTGKASFYFSNNWSTNENLTGTQIFNPAAGAFDYTTKNTFGSFSEDDVDFGSEGKAGLTVKVADITAADLMVQPNPPTIIGSTASHNDHKCDGIDGTVTNIMGAGPGMVNLYFKNFDNDIYNNNVGAAKWRTQTSSAKRSSSRARRFFK